MEEFKFSTIEEAVADLRAGKMIIAVDDPDRENEGDLICAAEFATLENVNFMASYAKGLICMPMSKALTTKLGLEQMVATNTDNHCTAFTVSIDHAVFDFHFDIDIIAAAWIMSMFMHGRIFDLAFVCLVFIVFQNQICIQLFQFHQSSYPMTLRTSFSLSRK